MVNQRDEMKIRDYTIFFNSIQFHKFIKSNILNVY